MKKVLGFLIIICTVLLLMTNVVLLLLGLPSSSMKKYYSDLSNYEVLTVNVVEINDYPEDERIYFQVDIVSSESSYEGHFVIEGDSYNVVIDNDILSEISKDDQLTITSAPGYFGDGYDYPIVDLSFEGKEYILFNDGTSNLLEYLEVSRSNYNNLLIKTSVSFAVFAVFSTLLVVSFLKNKNDK